MTGLIVLGFISSFIFGAVVGGLFVDDRHQRAFEDETGTEAPTPRNTN